MSKIDFTPLDTTATSDLPNSIKSAEISNVVSPKRCTPPIPINNRKPFVLQQEIISIKQQLEEYRDKKKMSDKKRSEMDEEKEKRMDEYVKTKNFAESDHEEDHPIDCYSQKCIGAGIKLQILVSTQKEEEKEMTNKN